MKVTAFICSIILSVLVSACSSMDSSVAYMRMAPKDRPQLTVTDEKNQLIFQGASPADVQLNMLTANGKDKSYNLEVAIKGVITHNIPLKHNQEGWFIAGNLVSKGPVGWLVVNPRNGALYLRSPTDKASEPTKADENSLSIVMIDDLPPSMANQLVGIEHRRDRSTLTAAVEE